MIKPNPEPGLFQFSFVSTRTPWILRVDVVSTLGQSSFTQTLRGFEGSYVKDMDLTHMSEGIYYLKITRGDKTSVHKQPLPLTATAYATERSSGLSFSFPSNRQKCPPAPGAEDAEGLPTVLVKVVPGSNSLPTTSASRTVIDGRLTCDTVGPIPEEQAFAPGSPLQGLQSGTYFRHVLMKGQVHSMHIRAVAPRILCRPAVRQWSPP